MGTEKGEDTGRGVRGTNTNTFAHGHDDTQADALRKPRIKLMERKIHTLSNTLRCTNRDTEAHRFKSKTIQ